MTGFDSIQEFFNEARFTTEGLNENNENKLKEYIAIYDGDKQYSRNTVISNELVERFCLNQFDWISSAKKDGEVYLFVFTEKCRLEEDIPKKNAISLHEKYVNERDNTQAFHGDAILRHLDLEPPVRFVVDSYPSFLGQDSIIIPVKRVSFIPLNNISVQVGKGYRSEV